MKVLLLIDNLNSGGAQRQIVNLAIGLKAKKVDVTVMTYNKGEHFQDELKKQNIRLMPLIFSSNLETFFGVVRALRKEKPDIICAYLFVPSFIALVSKFFRWRAKVFVSERFIEHLITDRVKGACRALYPLASGIIANSRTQTLILQTKYPRLKHKISHIANCVNVDVFAPRQRTPDTTINALGVGRLVEYKNVKVLIEAVAILRHQHQIPIRITWVGRPYEEEGVENKYYHQCIALIQQRNISDAWTWAGKQRNVAEQYQSNDLLLHPSYGEGFPNVICEALACGTPVIASNVIDHPYIIEEGRNGYLFEPASVNELVNKVMLFAKLTWEKRMEMSRNCRESAVEKFSPQTMISRYYTLFKSI